MLGRPLLGFFFPGIFLIFLLGGSVGQITCRECIAFRGSNISYSLANGELHVLVDFIPRPVPGRCFSFADMTVLFLFWGLGR